MSVKMYGDNQTCQIVRYLHCADCAKEKPEYISFRDWSELSVGLTEQGIQVWCDRHEQNVALIEWGNEKAEVG